MASLNVITRLIHSQDFPLTEIEVINLCIEARQSFLHQPMLLEVAAPINICGGFKIKLLKIFLGIEDLKFNSLNLLTFFTN